MSVGESVFLERCYCWSLGNIVYKSTKIKPYRNKLPICIKYRQLTSLGAFITVFLIKKSVEFVNRVIKEWSKGENDV